MQTVNFESAREKKRYENINTITAISRTGEKKLCDRDEPNGSNRILLGDKSLNSTNESLLSF